MSIDCNAMIEIIDFKMHELIRIASEASHERTDKILQKLKMLRSMVNSPTYKLYSL